LGGDGVLVTPGFRRWKQISDFSNFFLPFSSAKPVLITNRLSHKRSFMKMNSSHNSTSDFESFTVLIELIFLQMINGLLVGNLEKKKYPSWVNLNDLPAA
jgi:hypothetical protein